MRCPTKLVLSLLVLPALAAISKGQEVPPHFQEVNSILGKKGSLNADGSFRVNVPRTDVPFRNQNVMPIPADMGLATYAAFTGTPDKALVVGDVAMLRHEIDGVVDALRAGHIEVVALHNHMSAEEPRLFFVHFQGHGELKGLATTVRKAFDAIGKPLQMAKTDRPGKPTVDWTNIGKILGVKPQTFPSGVMRFANPRKDISVEIDGLPFLPGMGLGSWATFNACECGKTMVMGDTCTTRGDLQSAIDALRKAGISITAIHNHILGGSREVMFLHYEGEGDASAMATGIRNCWDALGKRQPPEARYLRATHRLPAHAS